MWTLRAGCKAMRSASYMRVVDGTREHVRASRVWVREHSIQVQVQAQVPDVGKTALAGSGATEWAGPAGVQQGRALVADRRAAALACMEKQKQNAAPGLESSARQVKQGQARSSLQLPASNYLQQLLRSPPRLVTGKRLTKGRALRAGRAETMRALAAFV